MKRSLRTAIAILTASASLLASPMTVKAECYPVQITPNTPTGIAGCEVWGEGTGSWYGSSGYGVAMNFCTWGLRHTQGCGNVSITSQQTGLTATVPVVDFCDCYTGTSRQRIVDMLPGVLSALGLNPSQGLFPVVVTPVNTVVTPVNTAAPMLPDTAMR
jgi:hypothetical protein